MSGYSTLNMSQLKHYFFVYEHYVYNIVTFSHCYMVSKQ